MSAVQLVAIVFGLAMAFATYRAYRRHDLNPAESAAWFAVWLGLIFVSAFPDALRNVVGPLKVARLLDLVMIAALLFLSTLVFLLNSRVRRLENRLVDLVRGLALSPQEAGRNGEQLVGEVHRDPDQAAQ